MGQATFRRPSVELKSADDIARMRKAGQIAGQTLVEVKKAAKPGVTTKDLSKLAEKFIRKSGAVPTFIGYRGYPAALCVSINEEVVHGIPSDRIIKSGDIVSVDVAATIDGFVGDTATTFIIGEPKASAHQTLVKATKDSLYAAIDAMKVGARLGDVSSAVEKFVEPYSFGVVRDFVGHGIGRTMHEEPSVPNYGTAGTGLKLEPGLVIAIEPMITLGSWEVKMLNDGWTVITADGSMAAHFEHTIALTKEGPVILTKVEEGD